MNKVEDALARALKEISMIRNPQLREFSQIIFAPNGTKVPKSSIEHAKPLAEHGNVEAIIASGIVGLFSRDLEAAESLLRAINYIHEATGARLLSSSELTTHIGTIIVNADRMSRGYDM